METIERLVVDKKNESISWFRFGQTKNITIPGLDQAIIEPKKWNILVLTGSGEPPNSLMILDDEGRMLRELSPPDGFQFYYLSNHPEIGGAVVWQAPDTVDA